MDSTTVSAKWKAAAKTIAAAVFWLAVWQILSMIVAQEILLPSPKQVVEAAIPLVTGWAFWKTVALSIVRIALGFLVALVIGCVLAVLTAKWQWFRTLVSPLLHIVRAAPVASFIIMALVWIRKERLPAFIAFLMVVPIVWANVEKGIRQTDRGLLEMAKVYRLDFWRTMWKIRLPAVMPYLLAACTTGLGFAWKSGVAAEVICRPEWSIGSALNDAKMYLETPDMFVWTAVVILLSFLFEKLLLSLLSAAKKRWFSGMREGDGV